MIQSDGNRYVGLPVKKFRGCYVPRAVTSFLPGKKAALRNTQRIVNTHFDEAYSPHS